MFVATRAAAALLPHIESSLIPLWAHQATKRMLSIPDPPAAVIGVPDGIVLGVTCSAPR